MGLILVAIGFGTLQVVLDRYNLDDGFSSTFICVMSAISAATLLFMVVWELCDEKPVVNFRLLKIKAFAINCLVMFLFGFTIYSTTQLLPQLTQELLGYDATHAGYTLGVGGIVTICLMPISGIVTGKFIEPKWLVFCALAGTGVALWYDAHNLDTHVAFGDLALSRAMQVMWLPFIFIPISAVGYVGIPPEKNNEASALINLMRNIGGSAGVSIATTELANRTQFHFQRLGEHISPYNGFTGAKLAAIIQPFEDQVRMMAYLDVFKALSYVLFAVSFVALLLPKIPKGGSSGGH